MYGKGLLKGMAITLRHAFERDITVQYPEERPRLQERFRGRLEFHFERCISCGLCTRACPNRVLSFESEAPLPGLKKKRLLTYTIDLQYCMFCALCVEICPTDSLYFSHQFELTCARRGDIRAVYHRPPELDEKEREEAERTARAREAPGEEAAPAADEAKRRKQVEAVKAALVKNPARALGRVLEDENDIALMAAVLAADEKKAATVAALLVEDPDKARKVVAGLLAREKKARPREGGGGQ